VSIRIDDELQRNTVKRWRIWKAAVKLLSSCYYLEENHSYHYDENAKMTKVNQNGVNGFLVPIVVFVPEHDCE